MSRANSAEDITGLWNVAHREVWQDTVDINPSCGLLWSSIPRLMEEPGYLYSYADGLLTAWSAVARDQQVGLDLIDGMLGEAERLAGALSSANLSVLCGLWAYRTSQFASTRTRS